MIPIRREQRPEEIRRALEEAARRVWGEERVAAQQLALDTTADALWQVAQHPLDLHDEEPE